MRLLTRSSSAGIRTGSGTHPLGGCALGNLEADTAEHLGEVMGECPKGPSWVASYQLDVICDEVTVAFAESRRVLAEGIGHPLRQSHANHRFPAGLDRHVHVLDFLAQGDGESGFQVV